MSGGINRRHALTAAAALAVAATPLRSLAQAAAETPPAFDIYARSAAVDQIALSPDGTRVAIITQSGDEKYVNNVDLATMQAQQLALGPAKIRGVMWADDNHVLVTSSVTQRLAMFGVNKHELYMARMVNIANLQVVGLFADKYGFYPIVMTVPQRIPTADGYRVVVANTYLKEPYSICVFSFGMDDPKGELVWAMDVNTHDWVLTSDGTPLACSGINGEDKLWTVFDARPVVDADPKAKPKVVKIYQHKDKTTQASLIGLGRDGNSLVIALTQTNEDDQPVEDSDYFELALDGTLGPRLDGDNPKGTRRPLFHPLTGRLCGFEVRDDWITYDFFDPKLKQVYDKVKTSLGKDVRFSIADYSEDLNQLIVYSESASDSGSYRHIDLTTGKTVPLQRNYPDLPVTLLSEKKPIVYKAADGLDIHGYLTLPPHNDGKNLPMILLPHGGPESRDFGDFDWQAQCFAARGYAVLQPNFRGSSGYGYDFVKAGHGEWGRKMQTDLSDGVRWLVAQGIVDPQRVAIVGASYGGYAALAGATLDPGIYRCAVSIAGVSDLRPMLDYEGDIAGYGSKSGVVKYSKRFLGDPKQYDAISPARQAAKAYCPILLIHGKDDTVVPIDQSDRMSRALKAAGKPVEYVTYKGQDHWETIESARVDMMRNVVAFLDKYNPA